MAKTNKTSTSRYQGKFVATATFNSKKVVAFGIDPIKVRQRAVDKGHQSPVIMYVSKPGAPNLF